jgi:hypothetical protein
MNSFTCVLTHWIHCITDTSQAGSTNRAQEHILQAMYLNVQHDLRAVSASATILQASCLERLGMMIDCMWNPSDPPLTTL